MIDVNKIIELQHSRGYSDEAFSYALGYKSRSTYGDKKRGRIIFTIRDLENICRLFDVPVNEILKIK